MPSNPPGSGSQSRRASQNPPLAQPVPRPASASASSSSPLGAGNIPSPSAISANVPFAAASPPIPNIPARSASAQPRSLSTSFRPGSLTSSRPTSSRPMPKASIEGLGRKMSPHPASSGGPMARSALTAQLGSSPGFRAASPAYPSAEGSVSGGETIKDTGASEAASRRESINALRPAVISRHSGSATPTRLGGAGGGGDESGFSAIADVSDHEKMKVLRRHLVSAEERQNASGDVSPVIAGADADPGSSSVSRASKSRAGVEVGSGEDDADGPGAESGIARANEPFPMPFDAPGMDVAHDLYKWQQDRTAGHPQRSVSFSHIPRDRSGSDALEPSLAHIREPGGFRRNFVVNKAQEQGLEPPTLVRNVVDFLFLYGHFAGEDLDEDEDESDTDDLDPIPGIDALDSESDGLLTYRGGRDLENGTGGGTGLPGKLFSRANTSRSVRGRDIGTERQPLLRGTSVGNGVGPGTLTRGVSRSRHRRMKSSTGEGTASFTQAVLMLLKGFVGTGILFMGKAFFNGGLLFSSIVLLALAGISLWAFLLLVQAYLAVPGSFGDIGGILYGKWMRFAILSSIAVSQIGFVAVYTVFIAENLQAFILAVTNCGTFIATKWLIAAQLVVFLPLAMIRNLAKLSGTALVADAFILIGILYIMGNETVILATKGIADVVTFNPDGFPLFIGTAVFTFEGIGLVIPITESMREPHRFPRALTGVMIFISILFAVAGVMGYAAYGSKVQTVVIVNLPQEDKFVQAVQFLYSIAILLSIPLQLFPAVRIMENGLFSRSGKHNPRVKWQKNVFRTATVLGCSLLSWAGSKQLDKFVSLVGSFACVPLCFIYPPLLHLRACATTRKAKIADVVLIIFGIGVCVFTTVQTIRSLFDPAGPPPVYGKCQVPG